MADATPGSFVLPRSLQLLLKCIWAQVLFPGSVTPAPAIRRSALLILLIVPGMLLYPCMGFHLFEPDEGRYAEIPREMLVRGDWVVPHLQGVPYLDKPPLFYWLVMASYALFGIDDWSARLVPALAVHGCVLLTYLLGRRSLGERPAFWGALLLGLAPGFLGVGRLLLLDGLLSLWVTLEIFCAFEAVRGERLKWGWWLLAAGACGLGVLTKGPIAVVLLLPPLTAYSWLTGRCCRVGWRALLIYVAIAMGVATPWFIAISIRLPEFPRYFLWEHHVIRFSTGFDHLRPFWFYAPIVLGGLLPGSLLGWAFLRFLLSSDETARQWRCPELGFLLLVGGWCVLFFSLSECKLPTYILPAFPPLALALGYFLTGSRWAMSRWTVAACTTGFVFLAAAHYVALPWYAEHHSPFREPEVVERYCEPGTPVVCYPRNCDSVAFYLGRDDLRTYRSKQTPQLIHYLETQPRTVLLFTHRHSMDALRQVLPPQLCMTDATPLCGSARPGIEGLCYMAVVKRR
ncbi:MAG: phospholipid carrier-dependent glycosyltransferase [Gemmataceae bacterium]|nr:phospholipid carrier-dependent glycosyltransferase [Gemmataceae bacterium]